MSIPRQTFEAELADRVGGWLAFVGKDVAVTASPNPTFNGPLAFALIQLGSPPADPGDVTDADLSGITAGQFSAVCDLAEVRALRSAIQNNTVVTGSLGPESNSWSNILDAMKER